MKVIHVVAMYHSTLRSVLSTMIDWFELTVYCPWGLSGWSHLRTHGWPLFHVSSGPILPTV
jgi:hypothetical protein